MKKGLLHIAFVVALLVGLAYNTSAQDFHFSQNESSPLYMNPALTGAFEGKYRAGILYRSQWKSVAFKPFNSGSVFYDMKLKKGNIGGYLINSKGGAGGYSVVNLMLSGSYIHAIDNHRISGGLQVGFINKSVDVEQLTFASQYNPQGGGSLNGELPSGEQFNSTSIWLPDVNLGLMYFYDKFQQRFNPFGGISLYHLTSPKESFLGTPTRLPRRMMLQLGTKINLNEKIQGTIHYTRMHQLNARENVLTLLASYYMKGSNAYLIYGTSYRNKDAVLAHLGVKYKNVTYRLSYDVNSSSLRAISNGRGGFELSVIYTRDKVEKPPIISCPRL